MATIGDGFKDIFLAGVGAMAITGEKAKDLVDTLISKGELTVDQGKQINTELKRKADAAVESMRFDALEARMSVMTPEERAAFAAKAAEIAARPVLRRQPKSSLRLKPSPPKLLPRPKRPRKLLQLLLNSGAVRFHGRKHIPEILFRLRCHA